MLDLERPLLRRVGGLLVVVVERAAPNAEREQCDEDAEARGHPGTTSDRRGGHTSTRAGARALRAHWSGQDGGGDRRCGAAARRRGEPACDLGGRPAGLPRPGAPHRRADRPRAAGPRASPRLLRRADRDILGGRVRRPCPRRDRRRGERREGRDHRRRHRPLPAGCADRPRAAPAAPARAARAARGRCRRSRVRRPPRGARGPRDRQWPPPSSRPTARASCGRSS